jgi:hypothetical protein
MTKRRDNATEDLLPERVCQQLEALTKEVGLLRGELATHHRQELHSDHQEPHGSIRFLESRAAYLGVMIALIAVDAAWLSGAGSWDPWSIPVGLLSLLGLLAIRPLPSASRAERIILGVGAALAVVITVAWLLDWVFRLWTPTVADAINPVLRRMHLWQLPFGEMSLDEVYDALFVLAWLLVYPFAYYIAPRVSMWLARPATGPRL